MPIKISAKFVRFFTCLTTVGYGVMGFIAQAYAQSIPGPADINRVKPPEHISIHKNLGVTPLKVPDAALAPELPKEAQSIKFVLHKLKIEGLTAYGKNEFLSLYQETIGQQTTLGNMYTIAGKITERYRADGYFLSRAFVPAQEIGEDGIFTIKIVEGYIGETVIDPSVANHRVVQRIMDSIKAEKPVRIQTIERHQLLLNDLPGLSAYKSTLAPMPGHTDGIVQLIFSAVANNEKHYYVSIDNMGSRYLGPYETTASWRGSLVPLQQTGITVTNTVPLKELSAINIMHDIPLSSDFVLELTGGYAKSNPGYLLAQQEIKSHALSGGIALSYKAIRQRQENLNYKLGIDSRDSSSKILGTPLSRDMVRALRFTTAYDRYDGWLGYNSASLTISHGINGLGASQAGDINLSRPGINPAFTKAEINFARLQGINKNWSAFLSLVGQKASGSLFSSEEFGFGGQAFGKAYDSSEITGDDGFAGSLELRYQGLTNWGGTTFNPYGFYDIGKVWNQNIGQPANISGASAGLGVRVQSETGFSGNLQLAFPLTKQIDTPLYGGNSRNARLVFQAGYGF